MKRDAQPPSGSLGKDLQARLDGLRRLEKRLMDWGPAGLGPQSGAGWASGVRPGPARRLSPLHATSVFLAMGSSVMNLRRAFEGGDSEFGLEDAEPGGPGDGKGEFPSSLLHPEESGEAGLPPEGARARFRRGRPLLGGRYRVVAQIGHGGMGLVCEAYDEKLGRPVALKFLPGKIDPFSQEALEATAALDHPGILRPIGRGTIGTYTYLVLPFVDGLDFLRLLRPEGEPSTPPRRWAARGALLLVLRKASAAVAYAHDRGVIHRDLKPSNILVTAEGRVIVMDWDVACRAGKDRGAGERVRKDLIVGTPYFMAPEHLRGREVTPAVDVFALGTILYLILTGEHPMGEGGTIPRIADRILHRIVRPPSAIVKDVPRDLDAVAMRALRKDPRERFRDAGEFLDALEDVPSPP